LYTVSSNRMLTGVVSEQSSEIGIRSRHSYDEHTSVKHGDAYVACLIIEILFRNVVYVARDKHRVEKYLKCTLTETY